MYRIWHFFIAHNRFSGLLMCALLAFGILSLILIPKESAPEVQIPVGVVIIVLPGASALDVETLVTNEIERGLSGNLSNAKNITSVSQDGVSSVTVEFDANADIDASLADLKNEIDRIAPELPATAEKPVVSEINFVDQPIMSVALSAPRTDAAFTDLAAALEVEIESISGVSRASFRGTRDREVSVIVDQTALARFAISISSVVSGIQRANQTLPVGEIQSNGTVYNVAFVGDIQNIDEIALIPIADREGQLVYVRDVATVIDGLAPLTTISRLSVSGEPTEGAIALDVYKTRGGDITTIAAEVHKRLQSLQEPGKLLEDVTIHTLYDSGEFIERDLIRLSTSGLQTVGLVMLLLILTLGWREGLVAGTAIPLSFVIGFIGLYLSGNTINFISLFALILAIGILVDSAIVVVEGINRRMKANPSIGKMEAALDTVQEFSAPLMSGTLTTVAMFSGLFIVSGVTGQFIGAIPFTINFILFASLLVALGFIPLIAAAVLRRRNPTRFGELQVQKAHQLEHWYRTKLAAILEDRKREQMVVWGLRGLLVLAILLPITGVVKVIFFEQSDADFAYVEVTLPEGSVRADTDIALRRVEEVLYKTPDVAAFMSTVGGGSVFSGGGESPKIGSVFLSLAADRDRTSTEIVTNLRTELADIRDVSITVDQPTDGPPTGDPLNFQFTGDDLSELSVVIERAAQILRDIPGTANVSTSADSNSTEFVLTLDKAVAATYGLDPLSISQTLRSAVYGSTATRITTLTDETDVVVKLNLSHKTSPDPESTNVATIERLTMLPLATPTGETVLLGSLVDTSLRDASAVIRHKNNERIMSISGDITAGATVREINQQFMAAVEDAGIVPNSVTLSIGGETEESNQAFLEVFGALILGVVLMLAVLVLQFNSFLHTRYVLTILPYSLIGIMAGLAITRLPLSFPAIMGFIALSGIVVNNAILLIDVMNNERRADPRKPIRDVVLDAAASRLRPILLTSVTTVVGMIPLLFASELWSPLAYAVMFGLTFSVFITLVLVPILYARKPGTIKI